MREKTVQPLVTGPGESTRRSDTVAFGPDHTSVTETNRPTLLDLPASWLDQLIVLGTKIPVDQGAEAALRTVVQTLAGIFPSYSIGARMPSDDGARSVYSEP